MKPWMKVLLKVLQKVFIDKKIGLLHPKSIVFIWFLVPFILTILTIYSPPVSKMANELMGFDIKDPNLFRNEEDRIEILSVFVSYSLLMQIMYAPFIIGDKRSIPSKITSIRKMDIPFILFRMLSIIIIPRSVSLFLKNNVSFKSPEHSQVASTLTFLTTNIGLVTLDKIWNPFSFVLSSILSILTITVNDSNIKVPYFYLEKNKYKMGLYNIRDNIKWTLGSEYPTFKSTPDDIILGVFLLSFWLIIVSSIINNIPFIQDFMPQQSFLRFLINVFTLTFIPIFFKNMSYGKKYSTEITTLGSLIGIIGYTII